MKLRRRLPKAESMRTVIVAAGGFSVGGLLMAGGLTFQSSHLLNDRINLQGQGSADLTTQDQPTPTGQAGLRPAAEAVAPKHVESTSSSSTTSSTTSHAPKVRTATAVRTSHRPVYRQAAPARRKYVPPPVTSSGS
jgi:hypothetical protein